MPRLIGEEGIALSLLCLIRAHLVSVLILDLLSILKH